MMGPEKVQEREEGAGGGGGEGDNPEGDKECRMKLLLKPVIPCIIQGEDLKVHALGAHLRPAFRPAHPRSEGSNCARPSAIRGAARNDIM